MKAIDVLELLENTSSTSEKQKILTANKDNTELAVLLDAALNFRRKFFVKKFNISEATPLHNRDMFNIFMSLLRQLEVREITGGAAVAAVEDFFFLCSDMERKWYARVLRKNLRAGFGLTEANKAGFGIPDFDVMLAKDGKDCKNLQKIVSEGVYVSPKLDGYRCIAVCAYGEVQLYSRNGTIYENFPTIIETLETLCKDSSFVLDGEIMSDDFNAMQQTAMSSKSKKSVGDVKYYVFGWVSSDEWNSDNFKMLTKQRLADLETWFYEIDSGPDHCPANLIMVEQKLVYKVEDIMKAEVDFMAKGYEGAMVLPNIPYYRGRKTNKLMKFKTMHSMDCKVVGLYEGEGRHVGRMGGLKLIQENGKTCDVGSGFTDEDREVIWNDPSCAVGRILEVKYQDLTPDGIMRFPVALKWRNDK
jgi:DNA ligase-1